MKFSQMEYRRPDLRAIQAGYREITEAFPKCTGAAQQMELVRRHEAMASEYDTMRNLALIRHSIDTTDAFYDAENAFFDTASPELEEDLQRFQKELVRSAFRKELEQELGTLFFENMERSMKTFSPEIIDLLQEENALTTQYEKLLASAKIPFDGKELNLSSIIPYQQAEDRDVRQAAWQKTAAFFSAHADELDELYDKLVKNRAAQAGKLGYPNYVELAYDRLGRNCYTAKEVAVFREQVVREIVPVTCKIRENQAKRVGLPKITFYDVNAYFPDGNPKPAGGTKELVAAAQKMYDEMGTVTGGFFRFMVENELFDLESKHGKQGGGYCTELVNYRSPFIFSNFNGTSGDVDVLTHEAGHALEFYLQRDVEIRENAQCTMETAEVHSMSMELFARPYAESFFGGDAEKFRLYQLESALNFLPYGCLVDEFQHAVYADPSLSPAQRKAVWRDLEKKYRPWMDFAGLEFFEAGGGYQRQHHIYSFPFYYIDYCLAQTVALEFWSLANREKEPAFARYFAFLQHSGDHTFLELVQEAGLQSPFTEGCLKELSREVMETLEQSPVK